MRNEELYETINEALSFALANLHTNVLCKVTQVNEKTINCKPVMNRVVNGKSVELPVFEEVPPVFMSGGTSYTAHPISVGDYCLLSISERCFDTWYNGDDFVSPLELRMHDYSDAFAIVGLHNEAGAITIPTVITQMGDLYADGNHVHDGTMVRTGDTTINGNLDVDGDITCTGRITCANATIGGIDFLSHVHGGVATGGSNTGVAS